VLLNDLLMILIEIECHSSVVLGRGFELFKLLEVLHIARPHQLLQLLNNALGLLVTVVFFVDLAVQFLKGNF
jgi:hypothetical protein